MECRDGYWSTLEDVSTGPGRYGIGAPAVNFRENLPTYLRITDIRDDGTLDLSSKKSVADPKASDYFLKEGDIVFARTGNSTGRSYCYDSRDGKFVYAGFLVKFSIDSEKVNPRYIKYYVQSRFYWDWISSFNTGSTRGNINAKTYGTLPIFIPSRDVQDKIVAIADSVSEKIRINNRINDYLSEIASALFSHEILESIDDTWLRASLLDIASYKNGLAMQKYRPEKDDPGLPVLKIKELAQGQCAADAERCRSGIDESVKIFDGDLIFSWSGTLLLDFWAGGNAGLNQHLFKVTSKKYKQWFYYFWTNYHMRKFITLAKDRATTMGHIKRSALAESEVYIPNENKMNELDKLFDPLIKKIISLKIESRILSELRNELLPKLMSGEIDVCKVGVLVERL